MIVLRGRWTKQTKIFLQELKQQFHNQAIQFTPSPLPKMLIHQKGILDKYQISTSIKRFLDGKDIMKKQLNISMKKQTTLKQMENNKMNVINQLLIKKVQRPQSQNSIRIDTCQVFRRQKKSNGLDIKRMRKTIKAALSLFNLKPNMKQQLSDNSFSKEQSSHLSICLSMKKQVSKQFSSNFTRTNSQKQTIEYQKRVNKISSEHKLNVTKQIKTLSLKQRQVVKGQINMKQYSFDQQEISLDQKLLQELKVQWEGQNYQDLQMLQILPSYTQQYTYKYGLKLLRKNLYDSNFDLIQNDQIVFSLQSIKQIDISILKKLLVAFNESGNWYDVQLHSPYGVKIFRLDSKIPSQHYLIKSFRYQRWPLLIKKALIKMLGGKKQVQNGSVSKFIQCLTGGVAIKGSFQKFIINFKRCKQQQYKIIFRKNNQAYQLIQVSTLKGKGGIYEVLTLFKNGIIYKMKTREAIQYFQDSYAMFWKEGYQRQCWHISINDNRKKLIQIANNSSNIRADQLTFLQISCACFIRFKVSIFEQNRHGKFEILQKKNGQEQLFFDFKMKSRILIVINKLDKKNLLNLRMSVYTSNKLVVKTDELDSTGYYFDQRYYLIRSQQSKRKPLIHKLNTKKQQYLQDS